LELVEGRQHNIVWVDVAKRLSLHRTAELFVNGSPDSVKAGDIARQRSPDDTDVAWPRTPEGIGNQLHLKRIRVFGPVVAANAAVGAAGDAVGVRCEHLALVIRKEHERLAIGGGKPLVKTRRVRLSQQPFENRNDVPFYAPCFCRNDRAATAGGSAVGRGRTLRNATSLRGHFGSLMKKSL
jgi:hypothetical protein